MQRCFVARRAFQAGVAAKPGSPTAAYRSNPGCNHIASTFSPSRIRHQTAFQQYRQSHYHQFDIDLGYSLRRNNQPDQTSRHVPRQITGIFRRAWSIQVIPVLVKARQCGGSRRTILSPLWSHTAGSPCQEADVLSSRAFICAG